MASVGDTSRLVGSHGHLWEGLREAGAQATGSEEPSSCCHMFPEFIVPDNVTGAGSTAAKVTDETPDIRNLEWGGK